MSTQSRQKLARKHVPQQIEMFAENTLTGNVPVWSELAAETQAVLTTLMMRLILDHAANRKIASTEDGHDL